MESSSTRQRSSGIPDKFTGSQSVAAPIPDFGAGTGGKASEPHPSGQVKHGLFTQLLRMLAFIDWFFCVCFS